MLKGGTGHQKEDYEGGTGDPFDGARTGDQGEGHGWGLGYNTSGRPS
jgi:hypothetical protein